MEWWNVGIMEYWFSKSFNPLLHCSILPVFQIRLFIAQKRDGWKGESHPFCKASEGVKKLS